MGIPLFLLNLKEKGLLSIIITSFNFKFKFNEFKFLINLPSEKMQLSQ